MAFFIPVTHICLSLSPLRAQWIAACDLQCLSVKANFINLLWFPPSHIRATGCLCQSWLSSPPLV